ncbi:MAG: hypothetical protein JNK56_16450 [Myxococcales bacterium]|nr:hypothetical protein [Myxococcales bacterium]
MTPRHRSLSSRPLVALACSLALALPASAHAREPEPEPDPAAGEPTDELSPQAQQHVIKAYQQYQSRAYASAEAELRRAAFFSPRWRPMHFNLAVMAEAQGKLGTAVTEYKAFQPFATPDESLVAEQRIVELDGRRRKIAGAYKQKIAVGAITMSIGAAATGGGVGLIVYGLQLKKDADTEEQGSKLAITGYLVGVVGLLILVYSIVPLKGAVKAKRQLDGLALGPTPLRHANGGVAQRF